MSQLYKYAAVFFCLSSCGQKKEELSSQAANFENFAVTAEGDNITIGVKNTPYGLSIIGSKFYISCGDTLITIECDEGKYKGMKFIKSEPDGETSVLIDWVGSDGVWDPLPETER
jgi:hypothetical protein